MKLIFFTVLLLIALAGFTLGGDDVAGSAEALTFDDLNIVVTIPSSADGDGWVMVSNPSGNTISYSDGCSFTALNLERNNWVTKTPDNENERGLGTSMIIPAGHSYYFFQISPETEDLSCTLTMDNSVESYTRDLQKGWHLVPGGAFFPPSCDFGYHNGEVFVDEAELYRSGLYSDEAGLGLKGLGYMIYVSSDSGCKISGRPLITVDALNIVVTIPSSADGDGWVMVSNPSGNTISYSDGCSFNVFDFESDGWVTKTPDRTIGDTPYGASMSIPAGRSYFFVHYSNEEGLSCTLTMDNSVKWYTRDLQKGWHLVPGGAFFPPSCDFGYHNGKVFGHFADKAELYRSGLYSDEAGLGLKGLGYFIKVSSDSGCKISGRPLITVTDSGIAVHSARAFFVRSNDVNRWRADVTFINNRGIPIEVRHSLRIKAEILAGREVVCEDDDRSIEESIEPEGKVSKRIEFLDSVNDIYCSLGFGEHTFKIYLDDELIYSRDFEI